MDIAKASNFERFIYDLHGGDGAAIAKLWVQLNNTGQFDLATHPAFGAVGEWLVSGASSHQTRIQTIRRIAVQEGRLVDPHTADGVHVAANRRRSGTVVCLETAQPTKFAATIVEALGQEPPRPASFVGLEEREQHVTVIEPDVAAVRAEIVAFANREGG